MSSEDATPAGAQEEPPAKDVAGRRLVVEAKWIKDAGGPAKKEELDHEVRPKTSLAAPTRWDRKATYWALASGVPLGALIGVILALTVNPIAASVTSSLMVLLLAVSTVRGRSPSEAARRQGVPPHLVGFAAAAIPAVLLGLYVRTHDALSPAPAAIVAQWKAAGLDDNSAKQAALRKFGLLPISSKLPDHQAGEPPAAEAGDVEALGAAVQFLFEQLATSSSPLPLPTPSSTASASAGSGPPPAVPQNSPGTHASAAPAAAEPPDASSSGATLPSSGSVLFGGREEACDALTMLITGASTATVRAKLKRLRVEWTSVSPALARDSAEERQRLQAFLTQHCSSDARGGQ